MFFGESELNATWMFKTKLYRALFFLLKVEGSVSLETFVAILIIYQVNQLLLVTYHDII